MPAPINLLRLIWLKNYRERIVAFFTDDFREPESVRIFFRALVIYTLVKMILIWPVCRIMMSHHTLSLPASLPGKIFLAPAFLANRHPDIFFALGISLLLTMLFVRSGIGFRALFFWLTFNLYIVGFAISDGADVVLFMLGLWSIPLVQPREFKSPKIRLTRTALFNLALFFGQLQIVLIYAVSGLDKLLSETWRSGRAFAYIEHLDFLYNPVFPGIFGNPFWNALFSWSTILFELLFTLLIWSSRMRLPMLLAGTVFHLFIFVVLSLPDFSLIMILSYLMFLRDSDYHRIKSWIRPKPL